VQTRIAVLGLEAVFEMLKQETSQSQGQLSPASKEDPMDLVQFAKNSHHKTLLLLLLYVAFHCPHA
jgi:hypothetical protein